MASELMRLLLFLAASIGAMVFVLYVARVIAREHPAEAPRSSAAGPAAPAPAAGPPTPPVAGPAQVPPPSPLAIVPGSGRRRLDRVYARTGVVLATILGPCRALAPPEDDRA